MKASEAFFNAYVECALWSSTDNADDSGGSPLDENYDADDVAPETLAEMRRDCDDFVEGNATDLAASGLDDDHQGHDFWLTRNRHGTGFWDRGIGAIGNRLSEAAHVYGSVTLYVHEGKVHAL